MLFISSVVDEAPCVWTISVDDASDIKGSGVDIVLYGPENILIEQSIKFESRGNINQAEYEALIAYMILVLEMGSSKLKAKSDSQPVANHATMEYHAKEP